ncbi:MAG: hypothetical protein F6K42_36070, partial [Leptolyngbya sp. SIO1D8]|nr:hypothetical protein [Leptolyngbya sp. SIO1D8]
ANGVELWKSDGTREGTALVMPIRYGGSSFPMELTNVNGALFFSALDENNKRALWRSDGTQEGTVLVKYICPERNSLLSDFTPVKDRLFFIVCHDSTTVLWHSNGEMAGTAPVHSVNIRITTGLISHLSAVGDLLYFVTSSGIRGSTLWYTDGTGAGTFQVAGTSIRY